MIVTLTPNPSIDRTITLAGRLQRGTVLRSVSETSQAAGKGVNISRAAVAAGVGTVAVVPAAATDAYVADLRDAGIDSRPVGPAGPIRVNLAITEPDGTTTKLNSPGCAASPELLDALRSAVLDLAGTAAWVVLAGSLPPGAPTAWYADLSAALRGTGTRIAVDTSDEPLAALVAGLSSGAPHLMKPNGHELASITGGDADHLESDPVAAARAASTLVVGGVAAVLVTLGANGAVLVTPGGVWHASPPPTTVLSTVGAGDCSLFGYLLGEVRGLTPGECLALAVAYGSAAAGLPGTSIPTPTQIRADLVSVQALQLTQGG